MRPNTLRTLSVELPIPEDESAPLPSEFRLFGQGVNSSLKGPVLYDATAATQTMTAWAEHAKPGTSPLHIDLEHFSLDPESPHHRTDAMGWAELESRADGSLWAVGVRWTPEGADRLRTRKQRFTSPAFLTEEDGDVPRVSRLINCAITALPATDQLDQLIAASQLATNRNSLNALAMGMDDTSPPASPEAPALDLAALAKGLGLPDGATSEDVTAAMIALLQSMGLVPAPSDEAPAEPVAQSEAPAEAPPSEEEKAAASQLLSLSATDSYLSALSAVKTWKASHIELETQRAKLAQQREILESAERRSIGKALVKAGVAPALVWADDDATTLSALYAAQPIAELRKMSERAGGKTVSLSGTAPVRVNSHDLSADELARCAERKIDPAKYAATKLALMGGKRA